MSNTVLDTIIIGAGISGLSCASHLEKKDVDFLLLSKDIGGRILTSEKGDVNYGAFFVCSDYDNVLKYATIKKRIRLRDFCFHEDNQIYSLFEPKILHFIPQFIKIEKILIRFKKHLHRLRRTTRTISQKKAIETDSFLFDLYMKSAYDFVLEQNLWEGADMYFSKALYATTFSTIKEMNTFSFLQFLLPLITPIYTFNFEKENIIKPFQDRIQIDTVKDIHYKENQYTVKTENGCFQAKNIVLATEITWSYHYAKINSFNKPVITNMLHIKGIPKKNIRKKLYHLFSPSSNVQAIADLNDNTYLLYYKNERPSLHTFFTDPQVIHHKQWNPAGTINGHVLIESNRGNSMYLIGDYNIAGLEETYLTGLYSANQIIQNQ